MAGFPVNGERYRSLDGKLFELKRQIRQPDGCSVDPRLLDEALQRLVEGKVELETKPSFNIVGFAGVPGFKNFNVKTHFKTNGRRPKGDEPSIQRVDDRFWKYFGGITKEAASPGGVLARQLILPFSESRVIDSLGENYKTPLSYLWQLMNIQRNGDKGVLRNDGGTNILYCDDGESVLRAVNVWASWSRSPDLFHGWVISARKLFHLYRVDAGDTILSTIPRFDAN